MKAALPRLPWWLAGVLAVVVSYAALVLGLLLAHAVTDPACDLPGGEVLVLWVTLLGHPWLGFLAAFYVARPERLVDAFLLDIVVGSVAFAVNLAQVGPVVFPAIRCGDDGFRFLGGLVVTGVAAALFARKR
jgi:hypothetical protein